MHFTELVLKINLNNWLANENGVFHFGNGLKKRGITLKYFSNKILSLFINDISISDMDSVRTQIGMLSMLSSQTDEISRETGVI